MGRRGFFLIIAHEARDLSRQFGAVVPGFAAGDLHICSFYAPGSLSRFGGRYKRLSTTSLRQCRGATKRANPRSKFSAASLIFGRSRQAANKKLKIINLCTTPRPSATRRRALLAENRPANRAKTGSAKKKSFRGAGLIASLGDGGGSARVAPRRHRDRMRQGRAQQARRCGAPKKASLRSRSRSPRRSMRFATRRTKYTCSIHLRTPCSRESGLVACKTLAKRKPHNSGHLI